MRNESDATLRSKVEESRQPPCGARVASITLSFILDNHGRLQLHAHRAHPGRPARLMQNLCCSHISAALNYCIRCSQTRSSRTRASRGADKTSSATCGALRTRCTRASRAARTQSLTAQTPTPRELSVRRARRCAQDSAHIGSGPRMRAAPADGCSCLMCRRRYVSVYIPCQPALTSCVPAALCELPARACARLPMSHISR
jgi:hypothetical protein